MSSPVTAQVGVVSATGERGLLFNSTLAFVLAAMVNDTLHELGHAAAALSLGLAAILTPFSVQPVPDGTPAQQIVVAAAGPVFSLVLGLVLMATSRTWGRGLVRLFFLWLSFLGVMNFVGYLEIAPFVQVGDTGQVLRLLHAPAVAYVGVFAVGVVGHIWLAYRFAAVVRRYTTDLTEERQLAFYAWIFGTALLVLSVAVDVVTVGPAPAVLFVVVFYSFAKGIFAPMQFLFHQRFPYRGERLQLQRVNWLGLGLAVALAAALILLSASGGVRLG